MQLQNDIRSTNAIIPWVIVVLMTAYVSLLSYYAENRNSPDPEFDFYSTTPVWVEVSPDMPEEEILIQGQFNNIIEGKRQNARAEELKKGQYRVDFQVNSPRPAVLYVNNDAIQIFLVPDSLLKVRVQLDPESGFIDTLEFAGVTKGICRYYQERSRRLGRRDIRSIQSTMAADSLRLHAHLLDSLAINELAQLLIQAKAFGLPLWFIEFEKNEILYQKAYLKQANAYNREVYPGYLDQVEVDNPDAVFSYYYYLYLRTFIQSLDTGPAGPDQVRRCLGIGNSLLSGEVRDVYLTSMIFQQIRYGNIQEARDLFAPYDGSFSKKKYERFLNKMLEGR